jgi:2-C-methyl-D-erythritol 4-phosphate cytidylyltransferase
MNSDIPKQFLLLHNKPILLHTIENWKKAEPLVHIILVLPQKDMAYWESICNEYSFKIPYKLTAGGDTRYHSVKNGLKFIENKNSLVAVHDGVRPNISAEIIKNSFYMAEKEDSAITVVALKDSIREYKQNKESIAVNREKYCLVQTPQTFKSEILLAAYNEVNFDNSITDDASVVEKFGKKINLINGSYANIKITTSEDLKILEALMG